MMIFVRISPKDQLALDAKPAAMRHGLLRMTNSITTSLNYSGVQNNLKVFPKHADKTLSIQY